MLNQIKKATFLFLFIKLVNSQGIQNSFNIGSLKHMKGSQTVEYGILVVDDNSPDGTAKIVKELQQKYTNLFIEERPGKAGLGTASLGCRVLLNASRCCAASKASSV